jgi:hypothetical protein
MPWWTARSAIARSSGEFLSWRAGSVQRTIVRSSRGARNDGRRSESSCSRNSSSRTERLAALIRRPGPCRSALKAGLRITLHSDYNVTPVVPLEFTQTAVTRAMRDGGEVLNPDERIGPAGVESSYARCRMAMPQERHHRRHRTRQMRRLRRLGKRPDCGPPYLKSIETWLDGYKRHTA